jgi:hypothetical protein
MMVAWDVLLLASSIWAIRVALRQLRAAKPTVDRRTLRLGYVILAVQGVALLGIGQPGFFLAGRAWSVLAGVWTVALLHIGLNVRSYRRVQRRIGRSA